MMTYDDAAALLAKNSIRVPFYSSSFSSPLYIPPHLLSSSPFSFFFFFFNIEISSFVREFVKIMKRNIIFISILLFLLLLQEKLEFFFCFFVFVASFYLLNNRLVVSTRCVLFVWLFVVMDGCCCCCCCLSLNWVYIFLSPYFLIMIQFHIRYFLLFLFHLYFISRCMFTNCCVKPV